jgi:DNA polymerase
MFVGEAPGAQEDLSGVPFVGAAGQLLDKFLQRVNLHRDECYIANILKCRPPGNRDPEVDEIKECFPFLQRQIATIRPRVLVTLGKYATQRLSLQWGEMRVLLQTLELNYTEGEHDPIPIVPTYHPSYLLRAAQGESDRAKALFTDTVARLRRAMDIAGVSV